MVNVILSQTCPVEGAIDASDYLKHLSKGLCLLALFVLFLTHGRASFMYEYNDLLL